MTVKNNKPRNFVQKWMNEFNKPVAMKSEKDYSRKQLKKQLSKDMKEMNQYDC